MGRERHLGKKSSAMLEESTEQTTINKLPIMPIIENYIFVLSNARTII